MSDQPFLPFCRPSIGEEEIQEVVSCLRSGWITTGPRCDRLEADFSDFTGAGQALAFSSCTAALHVSCSLLISSPAMKSSSPRSPGRRLRMSS